MSNNLIIISLKNDLSFDLIFINNCDHISNQSFHTSEFRSKLEQWINKLGEESAKAQSLKVPITSYEKFVKSQSNDRIYLLLQINLENREEDKAIGLIKIGTRNLFFDHNGQLEQVKSCTCLLDCYVSEQRCGFGKSFLTAVIQYLQLRVDQIAFDRPTKAMLSFLKKHFLLHPPLKQHNHFVIFDHFFI